MPIPTSACLRTILTAMLLAAAARAQSLELGQVLSFPVSPAGDVDGDGVADYVLAENGITVHSGATGAPIPFLSSPTATAAPAGDVDADGRDDIALVTAGDVVVASGLDGTPLHTWNLPSQPLVAGGADFDADGCDDVVLDYDSAADRVIEVRSGRTGAVLWSRLSNTFQWSVSLGDHDGDGCDDLAVATLDAGGQTWTAEVLLGPAFAPGGLLDADPGFLGDVNGNGTADYTRRVFTPTLTTEVRDGGSGLLLGTFPWHPVFRALGDVNGDGRADFRLQGGAFREVLSGASLTLMPGLNMSQLGIDVQALGDIDGDVRRGASGTTSIGHRPRVHVRGHCKLGDTVLFDLRGGMPNGFSLFLVGNAIDIDIGFLGAPGNRLYCDLLGLSAVLTDGDGLHTIASPIPVDPTLVGSTISVQSAAFDPAANAFGFVASNAIDVFIRD